MPRLLTKIELLIELPKREGDEIATQEISDVVAKIDRLLHDEGYVLNDANMHRVVNV